MRRWVVMVLAAVAATVAGCASGPRARFEAGPPQVLGVGNPRLASEVTRLAEAHRDSIARCFDTLAERTETDRLLEVVMTFSVRDAAATVTAVHPVNRETIVDGNLETCLETA